MEREQLEQYLDGEAAPAEVAAVEEAVRSEPAVAAELERLRHYRTLRAAALKTYEPSAEEGRALAAGILASFAQDEAETSFAPVARIGPWVWARRLGAVAAVLVVAAGSFWAGRASSHGQVAQVAPPAETKTVYLVRVDTGDGQPLVREFTTREEAEQFGKLYQERLTSNDHNEPVASSGLEPGVF